MSVALSPIDLNDPAAFAHGVPHEAFAQMRRTSGLTWTPDHATAGRGFWSVTRHEDLVTVSRDTSTYSSEVGHIQIYDIDPDALDARASMIDLDPPMHTRLRRIVSSAFTPRHVEGYRAAVRARVRAALDNVERRLDGPDGTVDWVATVAAPIPIGVICDLMGVPEEDHGSLVELSDHLVAGTSSAPLPPDAYGNTTDLRLLPFNSPAASAMSTYASALAARRRSEPGGDDLVAKLLEAEIDGERLSEEEFANFFRLMIFAGNETTRSSMAHLVLHLRDFPDVFAAVREDRTLLPALADEVIRYSSPILYFRRTVTEDTELAGTRLAAGDKIVMWYSAANFDEAAHAAPLEFRVDRPASQPHVAFGGGGAHFCLGASLARLELVELIDEILDRDLTLDIEGDAVFVDSNFVNGIELLTVARGAGPEKKL